MAYYDAAKAKWGTLTGTNAQRIAQLNALTVPVGTAKPAILTPSQILNAVVPADLASLTTAQVALLTLVLAGSQVDVSVGTTVRAAIVAIFTGKATTLAQLGALVAPYDAPTMPWWQATVAQGGGGLRGPFSQTDLDAYNNIQTALTAAQAKLAADQATLATLQAATPQVPAAIAAKQAEITADQDLIARLQA